MKCVQNVMAGCHALIYRNIFMSNTNHTRQGIPPIRSGHENDPWEVYIPHMGCYKFE